MPKWLGMLIHYLTFKKVLTSMSGWWICWGGKGKSDNFVSLFKTTQTVNVMKHVEGSHTHEEWLKIPREVDYSYEAYWPRWGGRLWISTDDLKEIPGTRVYVDA